MNGTYYRIQYDIEDTQDMAQLIDPEHGQVSFQWTGEDDMRLGVSCCRTLDDLRAYFSNRQWTYCSGTRVLELTGEETGGKDWDADENVVLVWPRRIVRVLTLNEVGMLDCGEPVNNDE